jgi:hypothetical protein
MKKLLPLLLIISIFSVNASAYGPRGHQLVGAIADKRLARNRAMARKVRRLLDGLTLERVATLPDEIKSWNNCGSRTTPEFAKTSVPFAFFVAQYSPCIFECTASGFAMF